MNKAPEHCERYPPLRHPQPVSATAIWNPDRSDVYDHPIFDANALTAQRRLWSLQGTRNTWFCGSYFGSGFHEDGLQAGLAVAEQLGGLRRPWCVPDQSGRIILGSRNPSESTHELLK